MGICILEPADFLGMMSSINQRNKAGGEKNPATGFGYQNWAYT
jgi:hypothetical protein